MADNVIHIINFSPRKHAAPNIFVKTLSLTNVEQNLDGINNDKYGLYFSANYLLSTLKYQLSADGTNWMPMVDFVNMNLNNLIIVSGFDLFYIRLVDVVNNVVGNAMSKLPNQPSTGRIVWGDTQDDQPRSGIFQNIFLEAIDVNDVDGDGVAFSWEKFNGTIWVSLNNNSAIDSFSLTMGVNRFRLLLNDNYPNHTTVTNELVYTRTALFYLTGTTNIGGNNAPGSGTIVNGSSGIVTLYLYTSFAQGVTGTATVNITGLGVFSNSTTGTDVSINIPANSSYNFNLSQTGNPSATMMSSNIHF